MAYKIKIDNDALNFLSRLPRKFQRQIAGRIDGLADNPRPPGCKKLRNRENTYRIRSGDYRIVYDVFDDRIVIYVIRIRHRKDVYRGF